MNEGTLQTYFPSGCDIRIINGPSARKIENPLVFVVETEELNFTLSIFSSGLYPVYV
jgi:hypothetical protein